MSTFLDPPLVARHGRTLQVLAICRISTVHQDEKSLADQEAYYRSWLDQHTDLPYTMEVLTSQGSGECLDRHEYLEAIRLVESRRFDLVICEDLGRICRRVQAHIFCETCEDQDTRLIAINDHVDTGRDDWSMCSFFAVMRHESYNKDTGQRIRRTLRHRFSEGGVFQCEIYGYLKPHGAKSDAEVQKDPEAEPIYREWFRRLENGATYAEIADWLNTQSVPMGPYCRSDHWDGKMVARLTHNPILKGVRVRNDKISRRVNKTGRRRSEKAPPEERLERLCPHLAFFEADYYDHVLRVVDDRNAKYKRKGIDGVDQRRGVPKKRTVWPGQHLRCGVCGRTYHWSGKKERNWMKCSGAHNYQCWNSLCLNGQQAASYLTDALLTEIEALPDFDECFLEMVREQLTAAKQAQQHQVKEWNGRLSELTRQIDNVTKAIADSGGLQALFEKLKDLEQEREQLQWQLKNRQRERGVEVTLPSMREIKQRARTWFTSFTAHDPDMARLMHQLLPELHVSPYRLCDGGAVVLRAHVTLLLTPFLSGGPMVPEIETVLRRELSVDLFDPPQRVRYREQVVALRGQGHTEQEVARHVGITRTAAQRAAALDRQMRVLALSAPYVLQHEPPDDYGKLRRHRHPRYRFEPLQDDTD